MTTPTLDVLEGFEHQFPLSGTAGTSTGTPIYAAINGSAHLSYGTGRLAGKCLSADGATGGPINVRQDWPVSQTRCIAGFFQMPSGTPVTTVSPILLVFSGATLMATVSMRSTAAGSNVGVQVGAGTTRFGPAITDTNWHLFEGKFVTSGTTWTADVKIDGTAVTQATEGSHSAANTDRIFFGTTSGFNAVVNWDDVIGSVTAADYDSANWGTAWQVKGKVPNAEGTDVLGTTNAITFTGAATGWQCTSELPPDTTTYVTYASTTTGDAASNYAEVAFADLDTGDTVWAVMGDATCIAASTATNALIVRLVDSGNATLTDMISGNVGLNTLRGYRSLITAPSGGWTSGFNGAKCRVGFSSDTNPIPRTSSLMLQYATPIVSSGSTSFVGDLPI